MDASSVAPAVGEAADFRRDTRVERVRAAARGVPALYRAELSDRWSASWFPFGGYAAAVALRAMAAEVEDPAHLPRTLTTVFSAPVRSGPVEIEVATLRAGRGMSQLSATLRGAGAEDAGHTTLAVFGASREGFVFTDAEPPDVPPPEECRPPVPPPADSPMQGATFFDQLEQRSWNVYAPWEEGWAPGRAEALRWMRFRVPPRRADGTLDPACYVALCDTMPQALGQRLGPSQPPFLAPSCDLNVHVLATTCEEWLLVQARCHRATDGYASATVHLWDRELQLVAHASQLMYLRIDPRPPA